MLAIDAPTRRMGMWSAALSTAFSLTYVVGQIAEWLGWLGSDGGPTSMSTPLGIIVLLTPSLLLGTAFLVMMVCIHQAAEHDRKTFSLSALAFATAYMVLISINYFVQLTWVAPRLMEGRSTGIESFLFVPFDSFLYSVDILGYSFMSVSTLFAAGVFTGRDERGVRWFMIANGMLLPFIALQMYWHALIWVAALWALTFPGATWGVMRWFRSERAIVSSTTIEARRSIPRRVSALQGRHSRADDERSHVGRNRHHTGERQ